MAGLDVHRSLPPGIPDTVAAAFAQSEWTGRTRALVALNLGPARQRATLHLTLSQSYLRTGELPVARDHLVTAEAICRSQRLARSLRLDIALTFSLLARHEGHFGEAVGYARQVHRSRTCSAELRGAAYLASATAQRLSGDVLGSLQDLYTAGEFIPGTEVELARLLTWLGARPGDVEERPDERMPTLPAPLQARLAWALAEQACSTGQPAEAQTWMELALSDPVAREEGRLAPLAAAAFGVPVPPVSVDRPPVRVLTLGRQGLLIRERFVPVPGDGALLAILAFLIRRGACHLPDIGSGILEAEPPVVPGHPPLPLRARGDTSRLLTQRLSMQVRRHLNTVRRLLADPSCVQTVRGIVDLAGNRSWSCDALDPGAVVPADMTWLPHLPGSWVAEMRSRLAAPQRW